MVITNTTRFTAIPVIILIIATLSCRKDENIKAAAQKPEKALAKSDKITHLYSDTVYVNNASPLFTVESGEQLIIDEGTVIKGIYFTVKPGGVIIANGTREKPIVFTSRLPRGNQVADASARLIIQGRSRNNSGNAPYDSTDFSGTLKYVRIEFGSLVLESVGSRTVVENVMVSYSGIYSSFELKGGTLNARRLVSYACGGPSDFYITQGYTGKLQQLLALRYPFFGSSGANPSGALSAVFIENNPDINLALTAKPLTYPYISNITALGPELQNGVPLAYLDTSRLFRSAALVTTANTQFQIANSVLAGFPAAAWHLDDSLTADRILYRKAELKTTIVQSNYGDRVFHLLPGEFPPYTSENFRSFMLDTAFKFGNEIYSNTASLMLKDPFNYENPKVSPKDASPLLAGASFNGPYFSDPYFEKGTYRGAIGKEDWLTGWTNFQPLKTNYNFQR